MSLIPPQYTDRFIIYRYNKALNVVQSLPASSNFQPTKNEKLELYALYKQVSEGDINTQRPGLFDIVGKAKWDAWKKLEGMTRLKAMHSYVEALLKVATEAYKRNMGRDEAQEIIHTFAAMKASKGNSSDDEMSNRKDTSSEDEEEERYFRNLQNNPPVRRLPSVGSIQTMVTAPGTPRQFPTPRPSSSMSATRRGIQTSGRDLLLNTFDEEEEEERMSSNPWVQQPRERQLRTPTSSLRLPSPSLSGSHGFYPPGSAIKQAIESLKNEITGLNKRVDDLRTEVVERDRKKPSQSKKAEPTKDSEDDGWKWVIKAALKYAGVNLMTAFILFIVLYRIKSPIAYAILEQLNRYLLLLRISIKPY